MILITCHRCGVTHRESQHCRCRSAGMTLLRQQLESLVRQHGYEHVRRVLDATKS
jgi:hypothetical protein